MEDIEEDNKLKDLNDLLKNEKGLIMKQRDAEDFEVFIQKMSLKRQSEPIINENTT